MRGVEEGRLTAQGHHWGRNARAELAGDDWQAESTVYSQVQVKVSGLCECVCVCVRATVHCSCAAQGRVLGQSRRLGVVLRAELLV